MRKLVYLTRALGIVIIVMVMTNILFASDEKSEKVEQSKYQSAGSETKADDEKKEDNIKKVVEGDKQKTKLSDKANTNDETKAKANNTINKENKKENQNNNDVNKDKHQAKDIELTKNTNDAQKQQTKEKNKVMSKEKNNNESVFIDIEGGIQSEEIANRLKNAGVISDSEAFNKFMIERGYDSNMRTGTFSFHKNMDYIDIRNILIKEQYR